MIRKWGKIDTMVPFILHIITPQKIVFLKKEILICDYYLIVYILIWISLAFLDLQVKIT